MAVAFSATSPARAFVFSEDPLEERSTELGINFRSYGFLLAGPILAPPYNQEDQNPTGLGLFNLRLFFIHRRPGLKVELHLARGLTLRGHARSAGGFALGRGLPPRRWLPLQTTVTDSDHVTLDEAVDWAYVAYSLGPLTITLGRQPVSFGRGALFKPLDLISTFSLTEVDTEYKPGADALRLDWTVTGRTQLTLVAAAGRDPADDALALRGSSLLLRGQHGWESGEVGLSAGFIRWDAVIGLDATWDTGYFDLYGEATVSVLSERSLSPGPDQAGRAVVRAVAGVLFKPWESVTVTPELYYNGFGAWDAAEIFAVAASERLAIGELSSLGQLYLALSATWEAHPLVTANFAAIGNLADPSALVLLGARYSITQNTELYAGCYLPLGGLPHTVQNPLPGGPERIPSEARGEFGLYPYFFFLQFKVVL